MLNSTMKADHEERCKAIRRGKASTIEVINYDNSKTDTFFGSGRVSAGLNPASEVKYRVTSLMVYL